MNAAPEAKKLGGLRLSKDVKLSSDGYDSYKSSGAHTVIPRHTYVESGTAGNAQESSARLEDGATLDLSKATPKMTKAAYELSVEQFPNAAGSREEEEKRKEYVWLILQKLIENPDLLNDAPKPSEETMLPRSKPEERMQPPPRAAEQGKFKLRLKKRKKPATLPIKQAQTKTKTIQGPALEPVPKPVNLGKLLQIPDLDYKARKPTMEVMFDFGALGKQRARYHWVGVSEKTLNLVFDTRFKMMDAYIPATIDDADHVTEVSVSTANSDAHYDYRCWGSVISMEFGVFKIVQLILVQDELGARVHEENDDGQEGDDRPGADSGGRGWADKRAEATQQEGLRLRAGESRDEEGG